MKVIKADPFLNPFKDLDNFFNDDWFGLMPAVKRRIDPPMDIYQTDAEFVVELQVPKEVAQKINVSVEDGVLKIQGNYQEETHQDQSRQYFRREIRRDNFSRMIALPMPVKEDQTKAEYENGVLKISIPKMEVKKPTKVEINVK